MIKNYIYIGLFASLLLVSCKGKKALAEEAAINTVEEVTEDATDKTEIIIEEGVKVEENIPQVPGIHFNKISFEKALIKAEKEDKLIFIDAYTVWCGPCKIMARNSFPNRAVGELYNANFINLKIDMERGEGAGIAKTYNVMAYPTLLIVDSNGKIVNKTIGMQSPEQLIEFANKALKKK